MIPRRSRAITSSAETGPPLGAIQVKIGPNVCEMRHYTTICIPAGPGIISGEVALVGGCAVWGGVGAVEGGVGAEGGARW